MAPHVLVCSNTSAHPPGGEKEVDTNDTYHGVPVLVWWASVGKICVDCRNAVPAPVLVPVGQYKAVRNVKGATLQQRFAAFHAANPWVYHFLCREARTLMAGGHKKLSINNLFEVLRWTVWRTTTDPSGATFKLNNNYRSRYVRLIDSQEPDLCGRFETRQLKTP